MLRQAPVCLAVYKMRFWKVIWSLTIPWSFMSLAVSQYFFLPRLSHLTTRTWSAVENNPLPLTSPIISPLAPSKLLYFSLAEVTGFYNLIPYFFTGNLLRAPTIGGRVFNFPKKGRGINVFWRIFPIPVNTCPMYFITCCRNTHSNWNTRSNAV